MWPLVLAQSTWVSPDRPEGFVAMLQDSHIYPGNTFGFRMGISGAGDVVVTADHSEVSPGVYKGVCYIYESSAGVWPPFETSRVTASDLGAYFGFPLAISGNGTTIIIGDFSHTESVGGSNHVGSGYVFQKVSGVWTQIQRIVSPVSPNIGEFSAAVGISETGDTIVCSARAQAVGAETLVGACYIYQKVAGVWSLEATLLSPVVAYQAHFGYSISLTKEGDFLAVGYQKTGSPIHIYAKAGGAWPLVQTLVSPAAPADNYYGHSLCLTNQGDTLGVYTDNSGAGNSAIYIYDRLNSSALELTATLYSPTGSTGANFGRPLLLNNTGELCITVDYADAAAGDYRSSVCLFSRKGNEAWVWQQNLTPPSDCQTGVISNFSLSSDGALVVFPGLRGSDAVGLIYQNVPQISGYLGGVGGKTRSTRVSLLPGLAKDSSTGSGVILPTYPSLIPGAASASAPAGTTVLLLHLNGANNSQVFTDSSASPLTFVEDVSSGSTVLTTSGPKLGSAALQTGALGDSLRAAMTSKVQLGTGAWNIQFFVRLAATPDTDIYCLVVQETSTTLRIILEGGTGNLQIQTDSALTTFSTTTSVGVGSWQHIEVSKDGSGIIRGFIEGALLGTTVTDSNNFGSAGLANIYFGYDDFVNPMKYDELRIVKGSAVHTASFTPPTTELS